MSKIKIEDLEVNAKLDDEALQKVTGGMGNMVGRKSGGLGIATNFGRQYGGTGGHGGTNHSFQWGNDGGAGGQGGRADASSHSGKRSGWFGSGGGVASSGTAIGGTGGAGGTGSIAAGGAGGGVASTMGSASGGSVSDNMSDSISIPISVSL